MRSPNFSLEEFAQVNLQRNNEVYNCSEKSLLYHTAKVSEEAGELVGAALKMERGFNPREFKRTQEKLMRDIANHLGVERAISDKTYIWACKADWDAPYDNEKMQVYWLDGKMEELGKEAADVFTTLFLVCEKFNIDLWDQVRCKFNKVSKDMKTNIHI